MKKVVSMFVVLGVMSGVVLGQEKLSFGVRAGVNSISQTTSKVKSPSAIGYSIGAMMQTPKFAQNISLQPHVLLTVKGGGKTTGSASVAFMEASFTYIEVPINVMFSLGEKLSVGAGPYIGYAFGGKIGGQTYTFNSSSSTRQTDIGYNILGQFVIAKGFGVSVNFTKSFPAASKTTNNAIGASLFKMF